MIFQSSISYIKSSIHLLIYIGLVAIGIIFIKDSVRHYLEEKTYLSTTTEPIDGSDKPTLTFCFEVHRDYGHWKYGTNFTMYIRNAESSMQEMVEGKNEVPQTQMPFHVDLTTMAVLQIRNSTIKSRRTCMKISPVEDEFDPTEFGQMKYYVYFYRLTSDENIDAKLYVTTEKNAYGVVFEKWYDGSVDPFDLKNKYFYFLTISDITETRYLPKNSLPYYQCLALQLKKDTSCRLPTEENQFCSHFAQPNKIS